jgi:hypothetical protein
MAGATTLINAVITGTGNMRRLQLTVLDMERQVPLLRSDTSESWQL